MYVVVECDCGSQTGGCTKSNFPVGTKSSRTPEQQNQDAQDVANIDLGDPDLQKAASKIQATFRKRVNVTSKKTAATVATPKPQSAAETAKDTE